MNVKTAIELLSDSGYPQFKWLVEKKKVSLVKKPFHAEDMYGLSFGSQGSVIDPYLNAMAEYGMTKGKHVVELMCGDGFESLLIQKKYKNNKYSGVDINPTYRNYLQPTKYNFVVEDITNTTAHRASIFDADVVFVGATNASLCTLTKLEDLLGLSRYIDLITSNEEKSLLMVSGFHDNRMPDEVDFQVDFTSQKVASIKNKWHGYTVHWGMITRREINTSLHHYYNVLALSKSDKIEEAEVIFYSDRTEAYRSWEYSIIAEALTLNNNFNHVPAKEDPCANFMIFEKGFYR